jgi:hypothetical protein
MKLMNRWKTDEALNHGTEKGIRRIAIRTLSLRDAADANSDGWAYWPVRGARRLIELIERDGTARYSFDRERKDVTRTERQASAPIKALRTHSGLSFEISDPITRRKEAAR